MAKNRPSLKPGQPSPDSRIYVCSKCGNHKALLGKETAPRCETCAEKGKKQDWWPTEQEILVKTKNIKRQFEKNRTTEEKASDSITTFSGKMLFVYVHTAWFLGWLLYNIFAPVPFDPLPFGLLTLIVSLEAIFLATFILISQNRQGAVSDLRSQLDYQVNIQAEKENKEALALLRDIRQHVKKKKRK